MQVPNQLYDMLIETGCYRLVENPGYLFDEDISLLMTGVGFCRILKHLHTRGKGLGLPTSLLKSVFSIAMSSGLPHQPTEIIEHNWKCVIKCLKSYIQMGEDEENSLISLLMNDDVETMMNLLVKLYPIYHSSSGVEAVEEQTDLSQSQENTEEENTEMVDSYQNLPLDDFLGYEEDADYNPTFFKKELLGTLEVSDSFKHGGKPKLCGDYISFYFEKCLHLRKDQVQILLGPKIGLTRSLFASGIHDKYDPFIFLIRCLLEEIRSLTEAMKKSDPSEVYSLMYILSSGWQSNDANFISSTSELIEELGSYISDSHSLRKCFSTAIEWFLLDGVKGMFSACSYNESTKKGLVKAVSKYIPVGSREWGVLISLSIPNMIKREGAITSSQLLAFAHSLLFEGNKSRKGMKLTSKEEEPIVCNLTCIVGLALFEAKEILLTLTRSPNSADEENLFISLSFLVDVWAFYPAFIENNASLNGDMTYLPKTIFACITKGIRSSCTSIQINSLTILFALFNILLQVQSSFAPVLYKSIVFTLIEFRESEDLRQFMVENFTSVLETHHSLPVSVIIGPLIRQVTLNGYFSYDFDFFIQLSKHSKLNVKKGIELLNLFGKMILHDPVYSRLASIPFLVILKRWSNENTIVSFFCQFVSKCLEILLAVESQDAAAKPLSKLKLPSIKRTNSSLNNTNNNNNTTSNILVVSSDVLEIRRCIILETLAKIVLLNIPNLTAACKPLLIKNVESIEKVTSQKHIGLRCILTWLDSGKLNYILIKNAMGEKEKKLSNNASIFKNLEKSASSPELLNETLPSKHTRNTQSSNSVDTLLVKKNVSPIAIAAEKDIEAIKMKMINKTNLRLEKERIDKESQHKLKEKLKKQFDFEKEKAAKEEHLFSKVSLSTSVVIENIELSSKYFNSKVILRELENVEKGESMFQNWKHQLKKLFKVYQLLRDNLFQEAKSLTQPVWLQFIKDFDYLITRDEANQLFIFHLQTTKLKEIDFKHFLSFLRVIAFYIYSKEKNAVSNMEDEGEIGDFLIKIMIEKCKNQPQHTAGIMWTKAKSPKKHIYNLKEMVASPIYLSQEEIKVYNSLLSQDPKTLLPEGLKSIKTKLYQVPKGIVSLISEPSRAALEIINDILVTALDISFLPFIGYEEKIDETSLEAAAIYAGENKLKKDKAELELIMKNESSANEIEMEITAAKRTIKPLNISERLYPSNLLFTSQNNKSAMTMDISNIINSDEELKGDEEKKKKKRKANNYPIIGVHVIGQFVGDQQKSAYIVLGIISQIISSITGELLKPASLNPQLRFPSPPKLTMKYEEKKKLEEIEAEKEAILNERKRLNHANDIRKLLEKEKEEKKRKEMKLEEEMEKKREIEKKQRVKIKEERLLKIKEEQDRKAAIVAYNKAKEEKKEMEERKSQEAQELEKENRKKEVAAYLARKKAREEEELRKKEMSVELGETLNKQLPFEEKPLSPRTRKIASQHQNSSTALIAEIAKNSDDVEL